MEIRDNYCEGTHSILFVDDSLLSHNFIEQCFEDGKFKIIHAHNGDEALRKYAEYMPDMIITDIEMPGINGLELCKIIKAENVERFIPVIIMSSYDNPISIDTAFEYGADDYIVKSSDKHKFRTFVNDFFANVDRKINNKILIVDDDKMILEIIRHAFLRNGFSVMTASNGKEALEKMEEVIPDIVITDVQMPIIDGFMLCDMIRKKSSLSNVEIIIMSSRDRPYDIRRADDFKIVGYFTKPFDVDKLIILAERTLMEKYHIYKKESEFMLSSIKALVKALEARDTYTNGHSARVTNYVNQIANIMGICEKEKSLQRLL